MRSPPFLWVQNFWLPNAMVNLVLVPGRTLMLSTLQGCACVSLCVTSVRQWTPRKRAKVKLILAK